ncbi:Uncharacterized protein APZ42_005977 [Daphnia magna]|uniref:Uncharacterized protein n=1 Tax=Daphnia magna TaxID=35525 RepID=A0A164G5B1_9CRUS|nr:Uncharacterized protein APZ42_005977 [Daphnia magna]
MPRRRNSELSRALRHAVILERRVAVTIDREVARQRQRVVIREPHRQVVFQRDPPAAPPHVPHILPSPLHQRIVIEEPP